MTEEQKNIIRSRLVQARASLDEAAALCDQGADMNFVMNSLYYAFLYPVLGLLQAGGITAPMQSTAISLFEREFVQKGDIDQRFLDAIRKAFDLRPACACEGREKALPHDVEELLPVAQEFIDAVLRVIS